MLHGSRFMHPIGVMEYAYKLVKEYVEHEREQDTIWKRENPHLYKKTDRERSKPGGF